MADASVASIGPSLRASCAAECTLRASDDTGGLFPARSEWRARCFLRGMGHRASLVGLLALILLSPALARAQVEAEPAQDEDALIEQDRVLSGRWLTLSGHEPGIAAFRQELHDLDYRLRGRRMPADLRGPGIGLIVPGAGGLVAGLGLLLAGLLRAGAHGVACGIGSLPGGGGCGSGPDNGLYIAGGVSMGVGALLLAIGLAVAFAGSSERRAFERRDEMREELHAWVSVTPMPSGGAVMLGVPF